MANWGKLGGSHSMHSPTGVGNQKPGVSAQSGSSAISSGQAPDPGPPSAGFYSTETTNKDYAGTQVPGQSAQKASGGNAKFAEGGKTPMFGHRGSLAARGGYTTPG
jgi:hypothetical protein